MDDRENDIIMNSTEPEKSDAGETDAGTPMHEQESSESVQNHNYKVGYDAFMYEPIGFEELEKQQQELSSDAESAVKRKTKRTKGETAAIVLFLILIIGSAALAGFGIVSDIMNSKQAIEKIAATKKVLFYKESKPENANIEAVVPDENGKYTIAGVAKLVKPSIVEIYTYDSESDASFGNSLGTGSGIVFSDEGYIITNAHVLKENGFHIVKTLDGKSYDAEIIGRDVKTDIAVIKVEGANLIPATFGDSDDAIVGEQVVAIGNPANLSSTVTDGIISAINRKIRSDDTSFEMNCIQTNADISPGNSGGALVNMYGQVIGITSSKYVSNSFEGLGFAITTNEALPIIEELIKQGYVSGRFRIGIQLIDMSTAANVLRIEELLGFELPEAFSGIYIDSISEDANIFNTKLEEGDFITEINGTHVRTYNEFYEAVSSQYGVGDTVLANCAHVEEGGKITCYDIQFKLMEDYSGNY